VLNFVPRKKVETYIPEISEKMARLKKLAIELGIAPDCAGILISGLMSNDAAATSTMTFEQMESVTDLVGLPTLANELADPRSLEAFARLLKGSPVGCLFLTDRADLTVAAIWEQGQLDNLTPRAAALKYVLSAPSLVIGKEHNENARGIDWAAGLDSLINACSLKVGRSSDPTEHPTGLVYSTGGAGEVIALHDLKRLLADIKDTRPALHALVMSSVMVNINFNKLIYGVLLSENVSGTFLGAWKVSDGTQVAVTTKALGTLSASHVPVMLDETVSAHIVSGGDYFTTNIPVGNTDFWMCNLRFIAALCAAFCCMRPQHVANTDQVTALWQSVECTHVQFAQDLVAIMKGSRGGAAQPDEAEC